MSTYNVIGIMSGTSLDGLDLCYCSFKFDKQNKWSSKILNATTVNLNKQLKLKLKNSIHLTGIELSLLNNEFGYFIGQSVKIFIKKNNITSIDFISSHGHTVFHQPDKKLTLQIGNGAIISSITQLPVICDFRTTDLALNGNGAPLVPIGDQLLFSEYDYCLNIGGIANISFKNNNIEAYDVCPANIVLNYLANKINKEYDANGLVAALGKVNEKLLLELNQLDFYRKKNPKSLGIEWIQKNIFPLLEKYNNNVEDNLRTFCEHIAMQISNQIKENKKVLITGGGAFNSFLVKRIIDLSDSQIILPSTEIINFKEALIFAFLGVLRYRNEVNVLKSATGAKHNNIGGCIYNALAN